MIYVFDSSPLITLFRYYYRNRFPTLWDSFDALISAGRITSTREVFNELQKKGDDLAKWCKSNRSLFVVPDANELAVVRKIFEIKHFQTLIKSKERLEEKPLADPFVIARAKCLLNGCVVTSEKFSPNAAKIPNVCAHESIKVECLDLEGFMEREGWTF